MSERFTDEPASSDAEALANLVAVFERLEGHPVLWIGQQLIDSNSEEDLLQNIVVGILETEKWKEIRSTLGLYRYARKAMINELNTLWKRAKRRESIDVLALDAQLHDWFQASPAETFELDREDKALIESLKAEFDDPQVDELLDRIVDGCERRRLPDEMKLNGREVTDLLRKVKRRRKLRERFGQPTTIRKQKKKDDDDDDDLIH